MPCCSIVEKPLSCDGGKKGKSPTRSSTEKSCSCLASQAREAEAATFSRSKGSCQCCWIWQDALPGLRCSWANGEKLSDCDDDDDDDDDDDAALNMVEAYAPEGVFNMDVGDVGEDEIGDGTRSTAVQDGGAAFVLRSAEQVRKYLTFLMENGHRIHDIPVFEREKGFNFGSSTKEVTQATSAIQSLCKRCWRKAWRMF